MKVPTCSSMGRKTSATHSNGESRFSLCWDVIREYCMSTSLHGLSFIAATGRTTCERVVWSFICAWAITCASVIMWEVWVKFRSSPTSTVVENPNDPLWKVPFPAVTVCGVNKVQASKARKVLSRLYPNADNETSETFLNTMTILSIMRYPYYNHMKIFLAHKNLQHMELENVNISDIMLEVMPTTEELFDHCYWKGREYPCQEVMRVQRTEEGFCYSFNSHTSDQWYTGSDERRKDRMNTSKGLYNNAAGVTTGFEVMMNSMKDDYFPHDTRKKGYNIIVHHPASVPDVSRSIFLPEERGKVLRISVSPSTVESEGGLKRLDVGYRRCIFPEEKELFLDRVYSESNCLTECRMMTLNEVCNCTPYFFPNLNSNIECGVSNVTLQCLHDVNRQLRNNKPPEGTTGYHLVDVQTGMNCSCLPTCSQVGYITEHHLTDVPSAFIEDFHGYVDVYFKNLGAVTYSRYVKFGYLDMLVSFGGIASLFIGFSFLSAVELIYYSFRFVVTMKNVFEARKVANLRRNKVTDPMLNNFLNAKWKEKSGNVLDYTE